MLNKFTFSHSVPPVFVTFHMVLFIYFQQDATLQILFISGKLLYVFRKTAVHVLGGISTHHQEHTQFYLQYLVLVKPLLLPATFVEELEEFWCGETTPKQINTIPTPHSNQFQLFHNSSR